MSRTLQWVIGISVVVVSLAIVFAVLVPWISAWLGWGGGYGMMGGTGMMGGQGMMGGGYGTAGGGTGMMGGQGMMGGGYGTAGGGYGMMGGTGMMPWIGSQGASGSAARLSIDQARTVADEYAAGGPGFTVAEVMEFENNFYAVVEETSTGRGAFEILIDPYTGAVGPEPGPNMMWNDKYGPMSYGVGAENGRSMAEARANAQQALESQIPGASVHEDGMSFYGYYTFDFDGPDGTIAGMISVEDDSGSAWLHTWHGDFISEWELEEASS